MLPSLLILITGHVKLELINSNYNYATLFICGILCDGTRSKFNTMLNGSKFKLKVKLIN